MPQARRCDKCGGELQYNAREHTYTCPYCGTTFEEDKQDVQININLDGQKLADAGNEGISVKIVHPDDESESEPAAPETIGGMTKEELHTLPREEIRRRMEEYNKAHGVKPTGCVGPTIIMVVIIGLITALIIILSNLKCDSDASKSATSTAVVHVEGREMRLDQLSGASDFSEGLASVSYAGDWGYFDTNGKMVIPIQFDEGEQFSEGMAAVRSASRWGYINREGKLVINYQFNNAEPFSDGMAGVEIGSKWGYIDTSGRLMVPTRYNKAGKFSGGMGVVEDTEGRYHLINKSGVDLVKFYVWEPEDPREGLVGAGTEDDHGYSYFNTNGKRIIANPAFRDVRGFHEGLAAVRSDKGWGFINKSGNFIIPPRYDEVHNFSNALAAVRTERDGDWAYIDATGKVILQLATSERVDDFSEEALAIYDQKSDRWGYIGKNGSWIIPPQFKDAGQFHQGWAHVRVETSYENYVNKEGKLMFPVYKP